MVCVRAVSVGAHGGDNSGGGGLSRDVNVGSKSTVLIDEDMGKQGPQMKRRERIHQHFPLLLSDLD